MPPKKSKDKKGKGKKSENAEPIITTTGEVIDENSKQFYLIQIRDLEDRLKRYQKKSDEFEILCKKYEQQYETTNADKKDIVTNLKKELEKKTDEILDLNDRLVGLQQAKDAEKEAFEKQLADLRTEFQEAKDVLTNQNNSLLAKLTSLEEFKSQKEELLAKLESLQETIDSLKIENENKINDIEKKVIIDNDRLKKDMVVKVSRVAAEFRRVSNKQMADTTKRTIKENVSINSQLQKMSDKVTELIDENDNAKIKDKIYKQQLDLLEDNEKELAKRNVCNLKVIRLLTEKCRSQEGLIIELSEKCNEFRDENLILHDNVVNLEENLKTLTQVNSDNQKLKEELGNFKSELELSIKHRNKIEKVLKQASDALVMALSKSAVEAKMGDEASEWNNIEKRDNMLEHLLILLNSAASLGFGPNPTKFAANFIARPRTSEYPGSGKGIRKNQVPVSEVGKSGSFNPHYELGDLGIVPRKNEQLLNNYEKMKLAHPQKELDSLKKLTKKTVATQTIDFTRASIFGVEFSDLNSNTTQVHPLFENNQEKRSVSKTKILMPINGQNRVTDKVF